MADQNISVSIDVKSRKASSNVKSFNKELKGVSSSSKKATSSINGTTSSLTGFIGKASLFVGAGAVVSKGFSRMMRKGAEFQQQQADLQAITGITGNRLQWLGDQALEASQKYGESASNIIEAQKLVASQLAEKIDFNTQSGVEQLQKVAEQAIVLQKAAGIDLRTAVEATTTAINQFNLDASQTDRIINSIAAGAKYGAAEAADQALAYRESGAAAAAAGQSFETLNAATQVLAANAIRGSRAGTQLRNIITILQSETSKLAEAGIHNVNLEADGMAATLKKLQPIAGDAAQMVNVFGRENLNAAQILIKNADSVATMTDKVTSTTTATQQAKVQLNTYEGAVSRLSATIDSKLIKSFQAQNSIYVRSINLLSNMVEETSVLADETSKYVNRQIQLNRLAGTTNLIYQKQFKLLSGITNAMGFTQGIDELNSFIDTLQASNEELSHNIGLIQDDVNFYTRQARAAEDGSVKQQAYNKQVQEAVQKLAKLKASLITQRDALDAALKSTEEGSASYEKIKLQLKNVSSQLDQVGYAWDDVSQTIKQTNSATDEASDSTERAEKKYKSLDDILAELSVSTSTTKDEVESLNDAIGAISEQDLQLNVDLGSKAGSLDWYYNRAREWEQAYTAAVEEGAKRRAFARMQEYNNEQFLARAKEQLWQRNSAAYVHSVAMQTSAAVESANTMQDKAKAVLNVIRQEIRAYIAEAVAVQIAKALKTVPFPFNLVAAAGAAGVVTGLFDSLVPQFRTGGVNINGSGVVSGPGTGTSDSIMARISNGESVINAASTRAANKTLAAINSSPATAAAIEQSLSMPAYAEGALPTYTSMPSGTNGFKLIAKKLDEQTARLERVERRVVFSMSEFDRSRRIFTDQQRQQGRG